MQRKNKEKGDLSKVGRKFVECFDSEKSMKIIESTFGEYANTIGNKSDVLYSKFTFDSLNSIFPF